MKKTGFCASIALLLSFHQAYAQTDVTGVLTDAETGEALVGASVLARGTTTGVVTDISGNYSITVPAGVNSLTFAYTGYRTESLPIDLLTVVDAAMEQRILVDEIVLEAFADIPKVTQLDDTQGVDLITDVRKLAVAIPQYIFNSASLADPVTFNAAPNTQIITLGSEEFVVSTWPSNAAAAFNMETGELYVKAPGLNGEIRNLGVADQVFSDFNLPFELISAGNPLSCRPWPVPTVGSSASYLNTAFGNGTPPDVAQGFLEVLEWGEITPTERSLAQQIYIDLDLGSAGRSIEVIELLPQFFDSQGNLWQTGRTSSVYIRDGQILRTQLTEQVTFDNPALVQLGLEACTGAMAFNPPRFESIVRDTTVPLGGVTTEEIFVGSTFTHINGIDIQILTNEGVIETIEVMELTMSGATFTNFDVDTGDPVRRDSISWKFLDTTLGPNQDFFDAFSDAISKKLDDKYRRESSRVLAEYLLEESLDADF